MAKFIKNLLYGASRVLILIPDDKYSYPSGKDFHDDYNNLRGAADQVARDLAGAVKKYDQQIYHR